LDTGQEQHPNQAIEDPPHQVPVARLGYPLGSEPFARADYDVGAGFDLGTEGFEIFDRRREISVRKSDKIAGCVTHPGTESGCFSAVRDREHPDVRMIRGEGSRQFGGVVTAAVINDQQLVWIWLRIQIRPGCSQRRLDACRFVVGWNDK
jgi:hypothetical protein